MHQIRKDHAVQQNRHKKCARPQQETTKTKKGKRAPRQTKIVHGDELLSNRVNIRELDGCMDKKTRRKEDEDNAAEKE